MALPSFGCFVLRLLAPAIPPASVGSCGQWPPAGRTTKRTAAARQRHPLASKSPETSERSGKRLQPDRLMTSSVVLCRLMCDTCSPADARCVGFGHFELDVSAGRQASGEAGIGAGVSLVRDYLD